MKLDHVVYFTEKAPEVIAEEQKKIGWHTVVGGKHEYWGTHNALMYLKNAYVEWLAVEHKSIAEKSGNPLVQLLLHDIADGENWGTICLSVNGIDRFNERLINEGYPTSGVIHAERKTITGEFRKWKMLFIIQQPSDDLPYPFFIQWQTDEKMRMGKLRKDGTILPDNERLLLTDCTFSVKNPEDKLKRWAALLAAEITEDSVLELPNCRLKFIQKTEKETKERLIDVSISHS